MNTTKNSFGHSSNDALSLPALKGGVSRAKTMSTVEDRVKKVVAERFNVKLEKIKENSSFTEDLGADSLDLVEVTMALEEEFDIEIPDSEAEKVTGIKEAVSYIEANL